MPLTAGQITAINNLLNGVPPDDGIYDLERQQIEAREDLSALLRVHNDFDNDDCTTALQSIKTRYKNAVDALSTLLT